MVHPKNISIADYQYNLPNERIAYQPLEQRDASKLLVNKKGKWEIDNYKNLYRHLPAPALMIFNNTRVVAARLLFYKSTGAKIEIFCLEPASAIDITTAMQQKGKAIWNCFIGGVSKWSEDLVLEKTIEKKSRSITLHATFIRKNSNHYTVALEWNDDTVTFAELLQDAGKIPLPPYIKREATKADEDRYQTVFAKQEGSVAAPTAGLHFTNEVLSNIAASGISTDYVTLHVGAGTFLPVKSATLEGHEMHQEFIEVNTGTIENLLAHLSRHVIVVGTTSLRTIESLYWLGVKAVLHPHMNSQDLIVLQWDAYELEEKKIAVANALQALLNLLKAEGKTQLITKTQLLITPGYQFKIVKGLVTNFHQPQSTLLLLIAAFIGKEWKEMYEFALANDFRFLSYGDGCYLEP
ncbi:S-adenosylmethionine:tRNA ribosyltransferase-isomerase [Gynurincola endophyticus]|uniref:S-adenosylmethionine:tRNA ribosyltransferase-isomerase n=1 Tax=Gynurincola endophyticus TaxID=2479004 RepID=UPI001F33D175|nr:S-adenosylmethionine:tRNA ribosyltransferase-isomerase [Gynurincola endophyticus]